jgi:TatD DNase family protein
MKTMTITDTHTHLYSEEFDQDRNEMIKSFSEWCHSGFIPAIDSTYTEAMYDLEKNYPDNVLMMDYPTYVRKII